MIVLEVKMSLSLYYSEVMACSPPPVAENTVWYDRSHTVVLKHPCGNFPNGLIQSGSNILPINQSECDETMGIESIVT